MCMKNSFFFVVYQVVNYFSTVCFELWKASEIMQEKVILCKRTCAVLKVIIILRGLHEQHGISNLIQLKLCNIS